MNKRLLSFCLSILPWMGAIFFIVWIFLLRFPLDGMTRLSFPFDGRSSWMSIFLPRERTTQPGSQTDGWIGQRILQDPVYASARIPGVFDEAEVVFETRFLHQSILEIGHSTQGPRSYELKPVWSEALAKGWKPVRIDQAQGFVRQDLPDRMLLDAPTERTLVWCATRPTERFMDPFGQEKTYERSLRGGHDYYFIPTEGEVFLRLLLQDMNRSRHGGNAVTFRLTHDEDVLWTDAVSTSGRFDERPGKAYEKTIHIRDLKPGIYRLAVIADDDIFIRRFSTNARHWVVGPRLYFGDTAGYARTTLPAVAWTNSQHLLLETRHQEGMQIVTFGNASVKVARTHETFTLDRRPDELQGNLRTEAPNGDIRFLGDGFFSFDPNALFLPTPRRLTDMTDLEKEGIYSVLTPYQPPQELSDGWKRIQIRFPIRDAKEYINFVLSMPGILVRQGAVDIRAVEFTYRRTPVGQNDWLWHIRRELANAWHRL